MVESNGRGLSHGLTQRHKRLTQSAFGGSYWPVKPLIHLCGESSGLRTVLRLALTLIICWNAAAADKPSNPSSQQLLDQAERCRRILRTSLIDFYLPGCVDKENGGYLETLQNGKFAPNGEKFLT